MTDVTTVPLGPIVSAVAPLLASLGVALLGVGVTLFAARYRAWTHKDMAQADQNAIKQSINTAAGVIFATAEAGISTQSIHVNDPRIATQVAHIAALLPTLLRRVGLTPDSLARLILGRLGELQTQSTATAQRLSSSGRLFPRLRCSLPPSHDRNRSVRAVGALMFARGLLMARI